MKIVIDIPEEVYKRIQSLSNADYFEHDICGNSMRRIANGKPLPKGHGSLIDVDDMLRRAKMFIDVPDKYISQRNKDFVYILEREEVIIQADKEEGDET